MPQLYSGPFSGRKIMPVRIVGMIGVAPPATEATVHIITGGISPAFLKEFAQAHEAADYDLVLVGYTSQSAEGFQVASYAAAHTERLGYLIAHRPGFIEPTLAARKIATFDNLHQGRIAVHIIAGVSDAEQRMDGDFQPKDVRYRRAAEYLSVMRRVWTEPGPFDHKGEFYNFEGVRSDVQPLQQPYPLLFFGGSSEGALSMGAEHCDVFAIFGEPLADTAARLADFRDRAAAFERTPQFNMSIRPILGATEAEAWERAEAILAQVNRELGHRAGRAATDESGRRILEAAARGDVHDARLWTALAKAYGAQGNTTCLVGTAEQVADALLEYYKLGIGSFLLRGFDPLGDVAEYGRELIPRIRAGAAEIDANA
jgi:alkanesulfonate monooxygenase